MDDRIAEVTELAFDTGAEEAGFALLAAWPLRLRERDPRTGESRALRRCLFAAIYGNRCSLATIASLSAVMTFQTRRMAFVAACATGNLAAARAVVPPTEAPIKLCRDGFAAACGRGEAEAMAELSLIPGLLSDPDALRNAARAACVGACKDALTVLLLADSGAACSAEEMSEWASASRSACGRELAAWITGGFCSSSSSPPAKRFKPNCVCS